MRCSTGCPPPTKFVPQLLECVGREPVDRLLIQLLLLPDRLAIPSGSKLLDDPGRLEGVLREVTLEGHTIRVRGKSLTRARVQSQFPAQVVVERSVGQACEEISGEQSEVLALRQRPQRGSDSWGEGSKSEGTRACSCTERLSSRAAFASSPASDVRPDRKASASIAAR
jgi:hypothetical protein